MTKRSTFILAVVFILLFALYSYKGIATLDPDFGWHIRAGEYIARYGFPYTDPFSYTMPSYLFVDHEWLTNLIWALLLPKVGYIPLGFVYALFAVVAIWLQTRLAQKKWLLLPVILVGGTLIDFIGVRTQVIDWFFISILTFVLWKKDLEEKWIYPLPLLFLLWANVHGGFGIGLGILAVLLGINSIEERKNLKKNAVVFVLSILMTLINPFGIRLWGEFLNQLTDSQLHWTVNEWLPAIYYTNLAFWIYTAISVFLFIRYFKHFSLTIRVIYILLFAAGMESMRNIPIFAIVSIYPTLQGIRFLSEEASKFHYGKERFKKGYVVFMIVALVFFLPQIGLFMYNLSLSKDREASYPAGAVAYLQNHLPQGNIMTSYGWAGYFLWKLPEKKDFIDGRMPSWRVKNIPNNESAYAFNDYQAILKQKKPFVAAVKKYNIDTLVVTVDDLDQKPVTFFGMDVEKSPFLKFLFGYELTFTKVVAQAQHMGWKIVYQDQTAAVVEK